VLMPNARKVRRAIFCSRFMVLFVFLPAQFALFIPLDAFESFNCCDDKERPYSYSCDRQNN
jgi:hypothetical protein